MHRANVRVTDLTSDYLAHSKADEFDAKVREMDRVQRRSELWTLIIVLSALLAGFLALTFWPAWWGG